MPSACRRRVLIANSLTRKIDGALASKNIGSSDPGGEQLETARSETLATEGSAVTRALNRKRKKVQVFSICPAPEFVINTAEFWKTRESGHAFGLMYRRTKDELHQFFEIDKPAPDWIRVAKVSPEGEVTYLMDF